MGAIEVINAVGSEARSAAYDDLRRQLGLDDAAGRPVGQIYDVPGAGQVNIAQYAMFVCLRQADANERLAASLGNMINSRAALISAEAKVMNQITAAPESLYELAEIGDYACLRASERPTLRDFLVLECEIDADVVDNGIDTFNKRQALAAKLEERMQGALNDSEFRQADLQAAVNRIEKCMVSGSNLVRSFGRTGFNTASRL